jgi:hypothetical protein
MPFVPDDDQSAAPVAAAPVAPAAPAATTSAAPIAKQSNFVPDPPAPWSIDWSHGGTVTLPQSMQDFGDIAGERASAGFMLPAETWTGEAPDVATAKARLDAAKTRLGPQLSTVADTLGYYASPTTLLNALPGGGIAAGALNEGLKSYNEGDNGWTVATHAGEGALAGGAGEVLSRLAVMPKALSNLTDYGLSALGGGASHLAFGDTVVPGLSLANAFVAHKMAQPAVKWVEENAGRLASLQPHLGALATGAGLAVPQTVQDLWNAKRP